MIHLKSDREIEALRRSADLVGLTIAEVARHIRPGVTTRELDRVAEDFIRSHGAKPAFKGYGSPRNPFPGTCCISVNSVVVHGIPGDLVLQEGDLISVDCGVELDGYYGDSAFTFGVGEISEEARRLTQVTYESLLLGVEHARAGLRVGDISSAVQQHCEAAGYGVVRDLVGHGIGRHLHEDPQVPNYGRRGNGIKLREGMVICIEPMINAGTHAVEIEPDGWTIQTQDRQPSAHYEHMVVVRKGAAELLTSFEAIEAVLPAPFKKEVVHGEAERN